MLTRPGLAELIGELHELEPRASRSLLALDLGPHSGRHELGDAIALMRLLRDAYPQLAQLVTVDDAIGLAPDEARAIGELTRAAGPVGFYTPHVRDDGSVRGPGGITAAMRQLVVGRCLVLPKAIALALVRARKAQNLYARLTPAVRETMVLAARNLTNEGIAQARGVGVSKVEKHIEEARRCFGVRDIAGPGRSPRAIAPDVFLEARGGGWEPPTPEREQRWAAILARERERLEDELGRRATLEDTASALGLPLAVVERALGEESP